MQSVEEALQVAALGVDHLRLTPSQIGLPGAIDFDKIEAQVTDCDLCGQDR